MTSAQRRSVHQTGQSSDQGRGPSPIRQERVRRVDHLWMSSPANRNALSIRMLDDLIVAIARSSADPTSRALIIDHDGPVFCAGVDVVERRALRPGGRDHADAFADLLIALWNYPKPLYCRVGGAVRGGGIGLVVCADVCIATAAATFAFSEVKLGVVPGVVGSLAIGKLGVAGLTPWLLSGEVFDATTAARIGLVSQLASSDGNDLVDSLIDSTNAAAPCAVASTKAIIRGSAHLDVAALMAEMRIVSARSFNSDEGQEGMRAFAEKRAPAWAEDSPA